MKINEEPVRKVRLHPGCGGGWRGVTEERASGIKNDALFRTDNLMWCWRCGMYAKHRI